jgi:hypothetical protein
VTKAALAIAARLRAGLSLDADGLDTLARCLGVSDAAQALGMLAADPESCEAAPFVALLFSPGRESMRTLEPALAAAGLDAAGAQALEAELVDALAAERLPVLMPGGGRIEFPASADDVAGYVRRLRPAATPPAELRAILARRLEPDMAAELGVILRHSRLEWTPERVFFMAALLDRADVERDDLPGLIAWAADFLDTAGLPLDPREALRLRRQALVAQLRQAEMAERALSGGNFETRMAQGLRLGHVHGPDVRRELALLDRACMLALGLPGAALEAGLVSRRDLGQADGVDELLKLMPGLED